MRTVLKRRRGTDTAIHKQAHILSVPTYADLASVHAALPHHTRVARCAVLRLCESVSAHTVSRQTAVPAVYWIVALFAERADTQTDKLSLPLRISSLSF